VGKSSLISSLIHVCRGRGLSVGVISVDPSSPFTQGAVLGDRIRLSEHFLDREVFIRSMGTRGHLGGLAEATLEAGLILDAAGKQVIFLETVGVGQSEVEILTTADTVILALMPGSGDSVQALKAGIMEIPDVVVVNKKDHPAAGTMLSEIRNALRLESRDGWTVPVVATDALTGEGVDQLWEAVEKQREYLGDGGRLDERRREGLQREIVDLALRRLERRLLEAAGSDPRLQQILGRVADRSLDPLTAVQLVLEEILELRQAAR
jgi:LAO/AO transport system kinase